MVTSGAALTMIVTVALPDLPPASVTVAVMVCVPEASVLMLTLAPVPRAPSRSEVHAMRGAQVALLGVGGGAGEDDRVARA